MNYQNDDDGDLSQNASSEEFKELAENNNKSQSKVKSPIIYDEDQKKNGYNENNNIDNRIDSEEKKEYFNLKISTENDNFIPENEHEINDLNEYEPNNPSQMLYSGKIDTNKESAIENSKILINSNDEYNSQMKSLQSQNNDMDTKQDRKENEDKNYSSINFYNSKIVDKNYLLAKYTQDTPGRSDALLSSDQWRSGNGPDCLGTANNLY